MGKIYQHPKKVTIYKKNFSKVISLVTLKKKSEAEVGISSKKQDPPPPDKMTLCSSSSSTRTTENILVKNIKAKPKSKVSSLLKIFESKSEARGFNQSEQSIQARGSRLRGLVRFFQIFINLNYFMSVFKPVDTVVKVVYFGRWSSEQAFNKVNCNWTLTTNIL